LGQYRPGLVSLVGPVVIDQFGAWLISICGREFAIRTVLFDMNIHPLKEPHEISSF
jgi:hypothetical protein